MQEENNIQHITETRIGNKLYIVTAECSLKATETIEQKVERILLRRISEVNNNNKDSQKSVAISPDIVNIGNTD